MRVTRCAISLALAAIAIFEAPESSFAQTTIDLGNNTLVYPTTPSSHDADLQMMFYMVATACDGGAWDGPGITSSLAYADAHNPPYNGVIDVTILDNSYWRLPSIFGFPLTNNDIVMSTSLAGDLNLNGVVDSFDYAQEVTFETNQNLQGDLNHDGQVDSADFQLMARSASLQNEYNSSLNYIGVPEPSTGAFLVLLLPPLLSSRMLAKFRRSRWPA